MTTIELLHCAPVRMKSCNLKLSSIVRHSLCTSVARVDCCICKSDSSLFSSHKGAVVAVALELWVAEAETCRYGHNRIHPLGREGFYLLESPSVVC